MGKLKARECEQRNDTGKDRTLSDGDGLFLRIRTSGTRTWLIEYMHEGRRTRCTLGAYAADGAPGTDVADWLRQGGLSLAQARAICSAWRSARLSGRDPAAEWQAARERDAVERRALEDLPTVQAAADTFLERVMAGKKSEPAIRYRLERLTATLGASRIREVTRQQVIAAIDKVAAGQRGEPAKQLAGEVLTVAKRLWRFAEERGWVEESCIERVTRAAFDARPTKRDVALRMDELAAVWRVLGSPACVSDPVTVAALRLVILTGQRANEVCGAAWTEFDLEAGLWRLPAARTKTARAHLVHLAPQAVAILRELAALTGKGRHAFASPLKPKQPIMGRSVNNALLALFKRGALPNVTQCTLHDFRRTLITRLPDLGFEPFIGHKIANHVLAGVFAHYNHNAYEAQRRAALAAWAERIETMGAAGNVRQLTRSA
jgi:integrase